MALPRNAEEDTDEGSTSTTRSAHGLESFSKDMYSERLRLSESTAMTQSRTIKHFVCQVGIDRWRRDTSCDRDQSVSSSSNRADCKAMTSTMENIDRKQESTAPNSKTFGIETEPLSTSNGDQPHQSLSRERHPMYGNSVFAVNHGIYRDETSSERFSDWLFEPDTAKGFMAAQDTAGGRSEDRRIGNFPDDHLDTSNSGRTLDVANPDPIPSDRNQGRYPASVEERASSPSILQATISNLDGFPTDALPPLHNSPPSQPVSLQQNLPSLRTTLDALIDTAPPTQIDGHTRKFFCRGPSYPQSTEGGFLLNLDRERHESRHAPQISCTYPGCNRIFGHVHGE